MSTEIYLDDQSEGRDKPPRWEISPFYMPINLDGPISNQVLGGG